MSTQRNAKNAQPLKPLHEIQRDIRGLQIQAALVHIQGLKDIFTKLTHLMEEAKAEHNKPFGSADRVNDLLEQFDITLNRKVI
jgi:hypothetical protein